MLLYNFRYNLCNLYAYVPFPILQVSINSASVNLHSHVHISWSRCLNHTQFLVSFNLLIMCHPLPKLKFFGLLACPFYNNPTQEMGVAKPMPLRLTTWPISSRTSCILMMMNCSASPSSQCLRLWFRTQPVIIDDNTFTTTSHTAEVLGNKIWLCNEAVCQL
jgi:hypothetical protein